jgi:hypothetical protein
MKPWLRVEDLTRFGMLEQLTTSTEKVLDTWLRIRTTDMDEAVASYTRGVWQTIVSTPNGSGVLLVCDARTEGRWEITCWDENEEARSDLEGRFLLSLIGAQFLSQTVITFRYRSTSELPCW